jgi:serine/threonine protein kinase
MDTSLTIPGYVMGTPDYIAPEVASSDDSSASVDIYSLGILLHEMFCGHTLTDVPTQNIPQGAAVTPTLCPRIPAPLDAIVHKATQHDPSSRYKTAAEMRDELRKAEDEFRSKEPIQPVVPLDGPATEAIPKVVAPVMSRRHAAASKQKVKDATHAKMAARRLRITTLVVVIGLIVVFAALGRFLGSLSQSALKSNNTPAIAASLTDAKSFDPFSNDKTENESQTNNLIDGDLGTSWTTQTYNSRKFGNLKAGVGFSLSMSEVSRLSTVTVTSPTADWEASVYLSKNNDTPTTLTGWGIPITQTSNIRAGSTTFRLDGTDGRHILVWITDLGPSNKVQIEEVSVEVR